MGLYLTQTQLALCIVVLSLITAAIKIADDVQMFDKSRTEDEVHRSNILYKSALSGFSFLAGLACYALGDVFAIISLPFIGLSLWYVSKVWVSVSALYTLSKKKRNAAAGSEEAVPLAADSEQEVSSEAADPRVQHDEEQAIPTPESRQ